MTLPRERVIGNVQAPHVAKRRSTCRVCREFIEKGELRTKHVGLSREWINGGFQNVMVTRYQHASCAETTTH